MWRVQSSMVRVVRCTLYRHCHHCHSHYQKCWCRIHLLRCLRSNRLLILHHLATCILQQNCCGRDACGGSDGGGGSGGGGGDGGGVSSLHTGFCVISALCFAGFISPSGNCCPLNHKGISSPSVFLDHPEVHGSICVSQWSVQCLYW